MQIGNAFPSQYLKAADLNNRQIAVTIDRIEMEEVGDGRKPVVYFQNKEKGLVLNKTNAETIAAIYGQETDDWGGGEIILYPTETDFQGKRVPAIRIRIPPRKPTPRQTLGTVNDDPVGGDDPRGTMNAPLDDDIPF